ncbi:MAG: hypothetical protein GF308_19050 [Candidatus Heimdallarchaeota archaeon]|nr:hypothetical protein [Candidatus Heimdallarchaeota archaeon]
MTEKPSQNDKEESFPFRQPPFEQLLANAPDSKCDLIDGQYFHHSPASSRHNKLRQFLESLLTIVVEEKDLGLVFSENFPVKLDESNWREPDIMFIPTDQLSFLESTIFKGTPSFIIEILSEDSRYRDEVRKRAEYEQLGVAEYWIIDPESFAKSSFFKLEQQHYQPITFSTDRLKSFILPSFFILKKWIWKLQTPPKLLAACKSLGL